MTTLTEFKEIEAKLLEDNGFSQNCANISEVQALSTKALPALIAVAEGMAEGMRIAEYALGPAGRSEHEKVAEKKR